MKKAAMLLFALGALVTGSPEAMARNKTAFDFSFTASDGKPFALDKYRGRTLLLVATNPHCSFTGQVAELQETWEKYHKRGLEIIAVPVEDVTPPPAKAMLHKELRNLCGNNFELRFPVMSPHATLGPKAHPFYQWLSMYLNHEAMPIRNMQKFLISPDGYMVTWFTPQTRPAAAMMVEAIENNLPPSYTLSSN